MDSHELTSTGNAADMSAADRQRVLMAARISATEAALSASRESAAEDAADQVEVDGSVSETAENQGDAGPRIEWQPRFAFLPLDVAIKVAHAEYQDAINAAAKGGARGLRMNERCRLVRIISVSWLCSNGVFYTSRDNLSASTAYYFYRKRGKYFKIDSEDFASWLVAHTGYEPTDREIVNLQRAIEQVAVNPKFARIVEYSRYFTMRGGAVYVSNGETAMYKITPGKIENLQNGTGTDGVFFPPESILPKWRLLPAGEEVDPISTLLYGGMEADAAGRAKMLMRLWLCSLPISPKCKPLLVFVGGVGSGKTKSACGVFNVLGIEPRTASFAKDAKVDDFWAAVNKGGVLNIDNVDSKINWLPDALAAASTGGVKETRRLYSNDEIVTLRALSWLVVTTANPMFAQDAGCADRILKVELFRNEKPTSDVALDEDIAAKRDGILSYIVRTVSCAMLVTDTPPDGLNRRHPDWAAWAWRIGVALGVREEAEAALFGAEDDKSLFTIQADEAFGAVFVRFMDTQTEPVEGKIADIIGRMCEYKLFSDEEKRFVSARSVGRKITSSWPYYRAVFKARKRILHGEFIYTFFPRKGGMGASNTPLTNSFEDSKEGMHIENNTESRVYDYPTPPRIQQNLDFDRFPPKSTKPEPM